MTFNPPKDELKAVDPMDLVVQDASEHGDDFQSMREFQIDREIGVIDGHENR